MDNPSYFYAVFQNTAIYNKNGLLHNDEGPAVIRADGSEEFWLFDKQVTEYEFNFWKKTMVGNVRTPPIETT